LNPKDFINAFSEVKANSGCAGADGVTIRDFERDLEENCAELAREIDSQAYLPLPLLKILIDKGGGETRALCVPAVRDRVAQTAVLRLIEPAFEKQFDPCSFGYRRGHSVRQAVDLIQSYYDQGYRWVLDCDIDAFFDSVDHDLLMKEIQAVVADAEILRLIRLWISGEVWDGRAVSPLTKGIPQGSPISPILANLFLDELDDEMLRRGQKIVRYADDFVVLCRTSEGADKALALSEETLGRLRLRLDEADITDFDHGFLFLGVIFLKSMALKSIIKKNLKGIIHFPGYLDVEEYLRKKKGESRSHA
jgi:group II intron reverse transcriptase/maturase